MQHSADGARADNVSAKAQNPEASRARVTSSRNPKTESEWKARLQWLLIASLAVFFLSLPLSESIKNIFFFFSIFLFIITNVIAGSRAIKVTSVGWLLLLFLGVSAASGLTAQNTWLGLRGAWDTARFSIVFFLILNGVDTEGQKRWLIRALITSLAIGLVWGASELWLGRLGAFQLHSIGHENQTATYLLLLFCLVLGLALGDMRPSLQRNGLFVLAGLILLAIFLTHSRTAMLAGTVVLAGFFLLSRDRRCLLLVGAGLIGAVVFIRLDPNLAKDFHSLASPWETLANNWRLAVWRGSWQAALDSPLLGVGPRNFSTLAAYGYPISSDHAHSLYFNTLAERGFLGLEALLIWLGALVHVCWRGRRYGPGLRRGLWYALTGALVALVVSGLFTTPLHTENAIAFVTLAALFLARAPNDKPFDAAAGATQ